jgi:hypothetical protein
MAMELFPPQLLSDNNAMIDRDSQANFLHDVSGMFAPDVYGTARVAAQGWQLFCS